jgi:RsiW-degrading membrane proteinase PrsW (M82 family)
MQEYITKLTMIWVRILSKDASIKNDQIFHIYVGQDETAAIIVILVVVGALLILWAVMIAARVLPRPLSIPFLPSIKRIFTSWLTVAVASKHTCGFTNRLKLWVVK